MPELENWKITSERFVAFFDILGFKELVAKNTHSEVLQKLGILKTFMSKLEKANELETHKKYKIEKDQTKSVTFSDSIIIFSKGATYKDGLKLFYDCYQILNNSLNNNIAIKGAISFGKITVDFERSLFFGQPIIDAYLLHEELEMLCVILDNKAEIKIKTFLKNNIINNVLVKYKAHLKTGKITHTLLRPDGVESTKQRLGSLENLYLTTFGRPRKYIDNTIEFINTLI